jgi:gas vesicle protein
MEYLIGFVVGGIVGFVAGFLVFRKHQKKLNEVEAEAKEKIDDVKDVLKKD